MNTNNNQSDRPDPTLRLSTGARRISTPNAQRLQTITEGSSVLPPPIPPRSSLRKTSSSLSLPAHPQITIDPPESHELRPYSFLGPVQAAPPAYDWVGTSLRAESPPVEDEKLAALRRGDTSKRNRGGWLRFAILLGLILLAIIALAVGLGVGLSVRNHRNAESQQQTSPASTSPTNQPFPLGEFSLITALQRVNTSCTSNPSTWSCYPGAIYNSSTSATDASSRAIFNWVITNSSDTYATVTTPHTSETGIPANLSISSTNNPLSIFFSNQSLTYISEASNSSTARYTFNFTMSKATIPTPSITSDNSAAECFFNQTLFTGNLYLSASRNYPSAELNSSSGVGTQWPYAVEITQTSPGGQDVPACYEYVNGAVGSQVTSANLTAQASDSQCMCDYRNF